jgi:hypothetical protein
LISDPAAYVISKNITRRHLTAEEKRELIAKLLKATPEKSDRAIADEMKVDKNVVSRVRKKAEATGAVAPVEKRTGKDRKARKQPATKAERNRKARAYRARQRQQVLAENRKIDQAGKAAAKAEAEQLAADLITAGLARRLYDHLSEYGAYELIGALMPDAETKRSRKRQMDQAVHEVDRAMQGRPYDERSAARAAERERLRKQWALEDDGTKSQDGTVSYPPHIARVTP